MKNLFSHSSIFRYRNNFENTIDEIENSYVFFPNRKLLNDPFDCYPGLMFISEDSEKLKKYMTKIVGVHDPNKSRQQRRSEGRSMIADRYEKAEWKNIIKEVLIKEIDRRGVGCFTKQPLNFMMWSHYANFHKGICVEYDIELDSNLFFGICPVNYVNEFEQKEYFLDSDDNEIEHLFYTKSDVWIKEEEYRVIKDRKGKHEIKPEALRKIIFGIDSEDLFIQNTILKSQGKYANLEYWKSERSESNFGIILKRI